MEIGQGCEALDLKTQVRILAGLCFNIFHYKIGVLNMKKSTKNQIIVLVIVLIFFSSSFAYIATSFGAGAKDNQFVPLESFIIKGDINQATESAYLENGFTFLKFHYSNDSLIQFAENLPEQLSTNTGQMQLILQEINDSETYFIISNLNGERRIDNPTQNDVLNALCEMLLAFPPECSILNIAGNSSV